MFYGADEFAVVNNGGCVLVFVKSREQPFAVRAVREWSKCPESPFEAQRLAV